jgi:hypothetical protein
MSTVSTPAPGTPPPGTAAPTRVIRVAVISFLALLALAALSQVDDSFRHWISSHHLGRRLPVGIVWFGAIGGSLASLTGIFWHHRVDWKDSYNLWHMLRPWTGLIMGSLGAFLLLVSTELATAGTVAGGSSAAKPPAFNPDVYYSAAFLIGFAEARFRALVKQVTDAILGPGQSTPKTDDNSRH